jgi:L-asparaginase
LWWLQPAAPSPKKEDPKTGALVPAVTGKDLLHAVPGLGRIARIEVREFSNIDSSHMTPEKWAALSRLVAKTLARPEVSGVVVTHGTDTMAQAAFFLDLTLITEKPVVLTGSMRGASELSADGPANLYNAITQAASPKARGLGVTVSLNQYAWAAACVRKQATSTVQTFDCGPKGFAARVMDGRLLINKPALVDRLLAIPGKMARVILLTTFAGDDGSMVEAAAANGAQGIVMEALGQGNVNPRVFTALKKVMAAGVTVVITSRVPYEPVSAGYGSVGGGKSLQEAGAILSRELRGPKARLLLMLALPGCKNPSELRVLFE